MLALGMMLVIATKGIDLSVGAVMAISGAIAASLADAHGLPLALAAALGAGLFCGLWNGFLVAVLGIQPIIATLMLMVAGRGVAQLITEGRIVTFTAPDLVWLGNGSVLGLPTPVVIVLGMLIVTGAVVRGTALGLLIEAVGGNAGRSAIGRDRHARHDPSVYVFCGLCAALAGLIVAADIMGADANNAGLWLELDAILAVVIGGTSLFGGRFSLVLAMVGALIIQAMNTGILLSGLSAGVQSRRQSGRRADRPVAAVAALCQCRRPCWGGPANEAACRRPRSPPWFSSSDLRSARLQFPDFASTRVAANLLTDNAFLGIAAVGMTFVIISGGIDLSVGSVIGFTTVFVALAIKRLGLPPLVAFVAILLLCAAFGAAMGAIIHVFDMPPFIVTLAGMFLARGASFLMSTESTPISAPIYSTVSDFALRLPGGGRLTVIGLIMLVVFAAGAVLLHLTRFGSNVYALGGSRATTALMGVPVGSHDDAHLYAVERPCRARRHRVLALHCGRLLSVGRRRRARRHRRCGDRRHLADRRVGLRGRHVARRADQGLIQTYIIFDGTLSSWWTKIVTGILLFAFIALQQAMLGIARRAGPRKAGVQKS